VARRQGYTLLELLMVLVILGLLLSVALPSVAAVRHQHEVRGSSQRFAAKHALARAVAIRMGRTAQLRVDASGKRVWVEVVRSPTVRDTVGPVEQFDARLGFNSNRSVLCFDARGLARTGGSCDAPDATVVFKAGNRSDTVQTTVLGRVIR
jgi:prepilin-type N-terminal cleavage/methylation domain-containing protein